MKRKANKYEQKLAKVAKHADAYAEEVRRAKEEVSLLNSEAEAVRREKADLERAKMQLQEQLELQKK